MERLMFLAIYAILFFGQTALAMSSHWAANLSSPTFQSKLDSITASKRTLNQVEILHMGKVATPRRIQEIKNAQSSIYQVVPYWYKKNAGEKMLQIMTDAKQTNPDLDIRFLFDWATPIGSGDLFKTKSFKKLEALSEGHAYYWNHIKWKKPWSLKLIRNRVHDKMMIFDNDKLIVGSMNVGQEHFEGGLNKDGWHDTDVLMQGPIAKLASELFLRLTQLTGHLRAGNPFPEEEFDMLRLIEAWLHPHFFGAYEREVTDSYGLLQPFEAERERSFARSAHVNAVGAHNITSGHYVRLIYTNPLVDRSDDKETSISRFVSTLRFLFARAQHQVRIYAPYLALTKEMESLLKDTAARGIKVELITNGVDANDLGPVNYAGGLNFYESLMKSGVTIYEWQGHKKLEFLEYDHKCRIDYWPGATMHSKAIMIDDALTLVGSHNLNTRSHLYNSEAMILVEGSDFNAEMQAIFEKDLDLDTNKTLRCADGTHKRPGYSRKITPFYLNILKDEYKNQMVDAAQIPEYL